MPHFRRIRAGITACLLLATAQLFGQAKIVKLPAPVNHPSINATAPYVSLDGNSLLYVSDNAEDNVLTLFFTSKPNGVTWKEPVAMPKHVNSRLNFIRGAGLSPDGKQAFISSTKGGGLGGYDLYTTEQKGAFWSELTNIGQPINSKENEACASLSPDGLTMFFMRCSRMDVSKGTGCRIMMTTRRSLTNPWQAPVELPANINTGNSQTPRIMGDSETLIFSSDKIPGKGGMDLFYTKKTSTGWSNPMPLDFVNTSADEQYVSANSLGRYLLMDAAGKTASELIEVLFPKEIKPKAVTKVVGNISGPDNLASPYVTLVDKKTQARLMSTRPGKDGVFTLFLVEGSIYNVVVDPEKDNFTFFVKEFDLTGEKLSTLERLDVTLKPVATGDIIELDAVTFKPGASELNDDAKPLLKKINRLITGSPNLKFNIEVSLYGYVKDSVRSNPDLTEVIQDTLHFEVTRTLTDTTGAVTTTKTDSIAVKRTYHNDRTLQQALEVVNYLIEQGAPAGKVLPSNKVFDAVVEERRTRVRLIAR